VKYIGRFMAILAAFLFVMTLPWAVWMSSVKGLLLDADTYKNTLSRQNLYTTLIPDLLTTIVESESENNNPDTLTFLNVVRNLDRQDWERIATLLIPADWLQAQVERNLDAFFAWLNGDTPTPDLAFDTASLRERLAGEPGQRVVNLILESWPPCTDEQLDVLLNFEHTDQPFPFCQPPGEYIALTSTALAEALSEQASALPDVVPAPDWLENPRTRRELARLKQFVQLLNAFVAELWLLPAALLALIVFFTVRSLKSFGRWSGTVLIVGGILSILPIPLMLSPSFLPSILLSSIKSSDVTISSQQAAHLNILAQSISHAIVGELTLPVLIISGVLIALGFIAHVVAAISRYPEENPAPQTLSQPVAASVQASTAQIASTPPPTASKGSTPPSPD